MKVFIAVDNSERSEKTFDWYVANFHKPENDVHVCHEAEQPELPAMMFADAIAYPQVEMERIVTEHRKRCEHLKNKYVTKCKEAQLEHCKVHVDTTKSTASHAIVKMAEKLEADLIVMGSRGAGLLRRTVMGSVSDYVLHHTHIPVLIWHDPDHHHHHHHH
ncbi:universal stress protein Sll1388-like [Clavelina lepadiformis]|uniref:UspA domain-containing protein n=1 Tax=Clavelina lepadiformis TaxID=159417 RepID=A0ABP0GY41_CLALP